MCATCVAQGIGYVGSALVGLQVMGARAKARRRSSEDGEAGSSTDTADPADPVGATDESGAVTSL
jgi:hypothetical protein